MFRAPRILISAAITVLSLVGCDKKQFTYEVDVQNETGSGIDKVMVSFGDRTLVLGALVNYGGRGNGDITCPVPESAIVRWTSDGRDHVANVKVKDCVPAEFNRYGMLVFRIVPDGRVELSVQASTKDGWHNVTTRPS